MDSLLEKINLMMELLHEYDGTTKIVFCDKLPREGRFSGYCVLAGLNRYCEPSLEQSLKKALKGVL